jgi:serine/threonine-protein kinase
VKGDPLLEEEPTIDIGGVLPDLGVSAGGPVILAGRYLLLSLIGSGGMGTVYAARDVELGEVVAVKVLRRELAGNPSVVTRFRQEVKLARRVTHRNVARTFDIGEHEGERFITMEYVEGESLSHRLAGTGRIPLGEALDIAGSVCAGLAAAHAAGIVHRDLKPENVLLAPGGRVVLTDFGVALPFEDEEGDTVVDGGGELIGTPVYMAPEQVEGRIDVDARADIYALGAILFEMVTGERPWRGESAWAVASARLLAPPPDPRTIVPNLPESVGRLILRCMARSPGDRYRAVEDVATELAGITLPSGPVSHSFGRPPMASIPDLPVDVGTKSVAVLPFVAVDPTEEPMALGMMHELIDALSASEALRVRGRRATSAYTGAERDVRAVGVALGTQAVIDGAIRRVGSRVQVVARLTAVADGFQLWAARFERPPEEFFSLVGDVVAGVGPALAIGRAPVRPRGLTEPLLVQPYLRAWLEVTRGSRAVAAEILDDVIGHAPGDPRALAARASLLVEDGEALDRATFLADKAAAIAPDFGPARPTLVRALLAEMRCVDASRHLADALRLLPGSADVQALYGRVLTEVGRPRQGLSCLDLALSLEPTLHEAEGDALRVRALLDEWTPFQRLASEGRPAPALALTAARLALWHADPGWAHALIGSGGLSPEARALAGLRGVARLDGPIEAIVEGWAMGSFPTRRRTVTSRQLAAEVYAFLGEDERALAAIEAACSAGLCDLTWLERCPVLMPLGGKLADFRDDVGRRAETVRVALRTPPA